jgi:hypothetical protein
MRADGVALPLFQESGGTWYLAGTAGQPSWSRVPQYLFRDTLGVDRSVATGTVVLLSDAYDEWGHITDLQGVDLSDYDLWSHPVERVGYVTSAPGSDMVFINSGGMPNAEALLPLFDSLAPVTDSTTRRIGVTSWEAQVGTNSVSFFEATRFVSGGSCMVIFGWLAGGRGAPQIAMRGTDDCEGKGMGSRRPWALVQRGSRLFAMVGVSRWEDAGTELWAVDASGNWSRMLEHNDTGHSMIGASPGG